jgi:FkbM family methyltransferase
MNKIFVEDKKTKKNFYIYIRPETTDIKAVTEVCIKKEYRNSKIDFHFEKNEYWLDLGGHIGSFSLMVNKLYDCKTKTFEADQNNFEILKKNMFECSNYQIINKAVTTSNRDFVNFFKPTKENDHYRYTECENKRPHLKIENINAIQVFKENFDGCKMDIEGSELKFIDNGIIPKCEKLVMEFHITKDRKMKNVFKRISILQDFFHVVHFNKSILKLDQNDIYTWGNDFKIWCMKRK